LLTHQITAYKIFDTIGAVSTS